MYGMVHSIETFSTLDGPGIRMVVFLQGCHLRCRYCQNPDTWKTTTNTARKYSAAELMPIIRRGQPYFEASGGGLTFSGGEPLLQYRFVKEVFSCCQAENIPTALDSSLYVSHKILREVLPVTDLILADIKHIDPEKSKNLTGSSNELNRHNLELINQQKVPLWVRYVVVPGITDEKEDIRKMAEFVGSLEMVERIDLLPYHTLGSHKWQLLGLNYTLADTPPPTKELLANLAHLIQTTSNKPVHY
ncbi:pyruvate formate-lyase-activating protein [Syntrophomonas erecta]